MGIDGLDGLTQFGMMNKISTGYSALDLLLCLCLPALLQYVTRLLNDRVLDEVSLGGWRKYPAHFWDEVGFCTPHTFGVELVCGASFTSGRTRGGAATGKTACIITFYSARSYST
jgi:hypothetical protein